MSSEGYALVGEKVWSLVGVLPPKDRTQLEERLRRVPGPSSHDKQDPPVTAPAIARLNAVAPRPASPAFSRIAGPPGAGGPSASGGSRLARPASPAHTARSGSPTTPLISRSDSPVRATRLLGNPDAPAAVPASHTGIGRPKSMLPSRLGRPRSNFPQPLLHPPIHDVGAMDNVAPPGEDEARYSVSVNPATENAPPSPIPEDITITISSILSSDPARSVDALKKIQKILSVGPEAGLSIPQYRELAEHTEGLIETITLQVAHVFERPEDLLHDDNFRLAKHLIQTLNNFCDHALLAESLTVDILTSLLEELTLRLLETDDSDVKKVKDLSRFINMIILRLFATGRRMSIFR